MFIVKGKSLGNVGVFLGDHPRPKSIQGTSMKVTIGGVTKDVLMVYVVGTGKTDQLAGVIPSDTPTGTGTLTVTAPTAPTISSIVRSPGAADITLTWTSVSNGLYRVQYKTDLAGTSWFNLAPDVTATGSTASFTDHPGAAPQRFYRRGRALADRAGQSTGGGHPKRAAV